MCTHCHSGSGQIIVNKLQFEFFGRRLRVKFDIGEWRIFKHPNVKKMRYVCSIAHTHICNVDFTTNWLSHSRKYSKAYPKATETSFWLCWLGFQIHVEIQRSGNFRSRSTSTCNWSRYDQSSARNLHRRCRSPTNEQKL